MTSKKFVRAQATWKINGQDFSRYNNTSSVLWGNGLRRHIADVKARFQRITSIWPAATYSGLVDMWSIRLLVVAAYSTV